MAEDEGGEGGEEEEEGGVMVHPALRLVLWMKLKW